MTYHNLHFLPRSLKQFYQLHLVHLLVPVILLFLFDFGVLGTVGDPSIENNPLTNLETFKCFLSIMVLKREMH